MDWSLYWTILLQGVIFLILVPIPLGFFLFMVRRAASNSAGDGRRTSRKIL